MNFIDESCIIMQTFQEICHQSYEKSITKYERIFLVSLSKIHFHHFLVYQSDIKTFPNVFWEFGKKWTNKIKSDLKLTCVRYAANQK